MLDSFQTYYNLNQYCWIYTCFLRLSSCQDMSLCKQILMCSICWSKHMDRIHIPRNIHIVDLHNFYGYLLNQKEKQEDVAVHYQMLHQQQWSNLPKMQCKVEEKNNLYIFFLRMVLQPIYHQKVHLDIQDLVLGMCTQPDLIFNTWEIINYNPINFHPYVYRWDHDQYKNLQQKNFSTHPQWSFRNFRPQPSQKNVSILPSNYQ